MSSLRRRRLPNGNLVLVTPDGLALRPGLTLACPFCGGDGMDNRFVPLVRESICPECRKDAEKPRRRDVRQPWEIEAA